MPQVSGGPLPFASFAVAGRCGRGNIRREICRSASAQVQTFRVGFRTGPWSLHRNWLYKSSRVGEEDRLEGRKKSGSAILRQSQIDRERRLDSSLAFARTVCPRFSSNL